jgi:glycosyltransferase involved in cell wall biosynthesis
MKVLFNTSRGSFGKMGGGEVQMLETKKELEKKGHKVEILEMDGYDTKFSGFDLFHNFNIHRDNFELVKKAKEAGLPVAVSTIYWPSLESAFLWNQGFGRVKAVASELSKRLDFFGLTKVRRLVWMADVLLPNSLAEAAALEKLFGVSPKKILVVPNGVDKRFAAARPDAFEKRFGLQDFVLYVGRIEPRKNVLSLIRAMKGIDRKLVVIGKATPESEEYEKKCKAEAGGNVLFIEPLPHESELLESAYAACSVFCLPSWYETPGLAALEAGLAGAKLVVTGKGCTKEYFGEMAWYVDPASVSDIREKVSKALHRRKDSLMKDCILRNFLWDNAARETEKAYEKALGGFL